MEREETETVDAIVVGGNMRGLVTGYLLGTLGYRAVLLERSGEVGGADRSFVTPEGTRFDHGLHVLDYERSGLATRLFSHVVDGEVHRVTLRRGIVLRNNVMPYAPEPREMPEGLRRMLPGDEIVDDLDDDPPSRERLAEYYGSEFAELVFEEVLPSYPSEARHLEFGVDESELLDNIYPWFFPRAHRTVRDPDESRAFHDRLRSGEEQRILYPRAGGFGGFARGFARKIEPTEVEVLTGTGDLDVDVDAGTHTVRSVGACGRRWSAPHVFWAAGWPSLCGILGIPCQQTATDRVVLGSFRFDQPATTPYHELLVGDPSLHANRIYMPARFRESDDPLVQVEFSYPEAEPRPLDPDHWRERWRSDLERLGLVGPAHQLVEFDFRSFRMHFNAYGMEGERLRDADPTLVRRDSNVRPVIPSMANLNLNRYLPRTVRYVTAVLASHPSEAGHLLPLAAPTS